MESSPTSQISFPYIDLYLHHLQASLDRDKIRSQISDSEIYSQIDQNQLRATIDNNLTYKNKKKELEKNQKELGKLKNQYLNISKTGSWWWKKSKEKNHNEFNNKNGTKMNTLKMLIKIDEEELSETTLKITQTFTEQMYPKILSNLIDQKLLKHQEFINSTIESNLYTLTCTQNPESSTTKISFTPLTSKFEINLIDSRVSSKFGLSEPKPKKLEEIKEWDFEEAEIALEAEGKKEAESFIENTGIDHFCEVVGCLDLESLDTIMLKNFWLKKGHLKKIVEAVVDMKTERLVFNNCRFKMSKISEIKPGFNEENKGPRLEKSGHIESKEMFEKEEKKIYKKKCNSTKKRALYSLSFIDCQISSFPIESYKHISNTKQDSSIKTFQTGTYKCTHPQKINEKHSMKSVILSIIRQIDSLKAFYKDRTLVSLTLQNLYLPESSITAIQDACPFLGIFIVGDEVQEN
ncbi:unnamed protein product [Moneuplotes crassus]|uniref:Uncharacterized protein n=1 Tax=Euplotes crassus TaxID=5936 RepID=A0AAD1U652_EUPCR|nr:unnamed protein product [Moneuplotes crassus]